MSKSVKLSMAMIVAVVVALTAAFVVSRTGEEEAPTDSDGVAKTLVRDDSPRLTSGDDVVLVEFLDFECEACKEAHPVMEDLREEYGDRVTFVVRHLPLHGNSMNAALASEAAAEQGEFEAMHDALFENVDEWGHEEGSQARVIEGYAKDLGLDMEQYRVDVKDPAIKERVEQSQQDARALGVTGTPTFFLDGGLIEPATVGDFEAELDAALED